MGAEAAEGAWVFVPEGALSPVEALRGAAAAAALRGPMGPAEPR